MPEPEDIKPEPDDTAAETEEPEVVAHESESADDWCVFNLSEL